MKAQTVREQLRGVVDPRTLKILEAMASDINGLQHSIVQIGQLIDRLATLMAVHTRVLGNLEEVEKAKQEARELGKGTQNLTETVRSEKADD